MPNLLLGLTLLAAAIFLLTLTVFRLIRAYRDGGKTGLKAYIADNIGRQYTDPILIAISGSVVLLVSIYFITNFVQVAIGVFLFGITLFPYLIFSLVFGIIHSRHKRQARLRRIALRQRSHPR